MKLTDFLWQSIQPVYQNILQHPFIQELQQGCLSHTTFSYYLQQDALYLADFGRALAMAGAKASCNNDFLECLSFATGAITAEMRLHQQFFQQFKIIPQQEKSLSCLAYTQFLLATASHASFAEAMAALLPCFWIYREVGCQLQINSTHTNPYHDWIKTYSDPEFNAVVEKAIAITNTAAEHVSESSLNKMQSLFMTSAKLEWAFWNEAYKIS